jgi:hypothetical protein
LSPRRQECAKLPGCCYPGLDKLYDLMRSGRLRSVKDGGARFIAGDALQAYVSKLEAEGEAA